MADITAKNTPMWVKKKLEQAKGSDTWLELLIDGAKHRGVTIDYQPLGIGRPTKEEAEKHYESYSLIGSAKTE